MRSMAAIAALGVMAVAGPATAEDSDARPVYMDKCLACHGETGAPTPPFAKRGVKDLSDPEWQESRTDDQIRESIAKGAEGTLMRAFDRELDGEQIDGLVAFIRNMRREE